MVVSNEVQLTYFVTVLKYIFQVSVLYWSSFILSNFYFYFTTFQERSQKGDSGCASEKLGVPHLLSD